MQFTFSAGGQPADVKRSVEQQSLGIQKQSTPKAAECTAAVGVAVGSYLDALNPTDSVSVSVSFGISHSTPI